MKSILRGVLFDFDGTLAPNLDLPDMRRQVVELTQAHNVPQEIFADRYIVEIIDVSSAWLLANQEDGNGYAEQAHRLIRDIEMQAAADTTRFDDVPPFLADLRRQNVATAVVTRNCREAVLLTYPDLLADVDALFARDDVTHLKPDTRHLEQALTTLGISSTEAAMVGDGRLDMHAGRALGMHCVGVLTGSANEADLLTAGADRVLHRATALTLD